MITFRGTCSYDVRIRLARWFASKPWTGAKPFGYLAETKFILRITVFASLLPENFLLETQMAGQQLVKFRPKPGIVTA